MLLLFHCLLLVQEGLRECGVRVHFGRIKSHAIKLQVHTINTNVVRVLSFVRLCILCTACVEDDFYSSFYILYGPPYAQNYIKYPSAPGRTTLHPSAIVIHSGINFASLC